MYIYIYIFTYIYMYIYVYIIYLACRSFEATYARRHRHHRAVA